MNRSIADKRVLSRHKNYIKALRVTQPSQMQKPVDLLAHAFEQTVHQEKPSAGLPECGLGRYIHQSSLALDWSQKSVFVEDLVGTSIAFCWRSLTIAWLLWYNRTRLHSTLAYISPVQFEQNWLANQPKQARS